MKILLRPVLFLALLATARAVTLEQLAADPSRWPAEVTVTAATRGTVLKDGQPAGMMLVGAGKTLIVTGIAADGVTGKIGGETVRVPVDKTDLHARTGAGKAPPPPPARAEAPAATTAAQPARAASGPARMQRLLTGRLVRLDGGSLKPVDDASLAGVKYYALYFSASWCGPCRQFTPQLVKAYRQLKERHPEFELVFVSADRSAGDMRDYMRGDKMPWPAVKFDARTQELVDYSGPGIPCLVLVNEHGRVLSDSYVGDNYVGPGKVLQDTQRILQRGG
jgi:nucleoredoxin